MRAECQFAKAGQGLFYNGILTDRKGHVFSFVYDCGTLSNERILNDSVNDFRGFIKKRLDMLFISHLHKDHISHIPKLIENISLDTVVLPSIDPEIRLLLASTIDGIEINHELVALYTDPARYFAERGANQIIILASDTNGGEPLFADEEDKDNQENDREWDNPNEIRIFSRSNSVNQYSMFEATVLEYEGVTRFRIPCYSWEFRALNLHYDLYDCDFKKEVCKILKANDGDIGIILRNPVLTKQLREIYEQHFTGGRKKLNETSLIVRSRPILRGFISDNGVLPCQYQFKNDDMCQRKCHENGHAETLLLGDISLNYKLADRLLYHHFKRCDLLPRVIQLPHHGTRIPCSPICCDWFHHIGEQGLCTTIVASYGLTNSYGHPDFLWNMDCCDYCHDKHPMIRLVNERQDYLYTVVCED